MQVKCQICQHEQLASDYNDWMCAECGQQYEYEEGHRILLTPEQIEMLRDRPYASKPLPPNPTHFYEGCDPK